MLKHANDKALELVNNGDSGFDARTKINAGITLAEEAESVASQALATANSASTTANNAVRRSGDTMTGNLLISQPTGGIQLKASTLEQTDITHVRADGTAAHTIRHAESGNNTLFIARDATGTALRNYLQHDAVSGQTGVWKPYSTSDQGTEDSALTRRDFVRASIPTRKKSEVHWTGLNAVLTAGTPVNIVTLLNGTLAASGSWAPMFNPTTGKLTPFNDDRTVTFKLNLIGTFAGGSANRALQLDFAGTVGNRIVVMRDSNISPSPNSIQFSTFFSVDKNGNMATNGTEPIITALSGDFTISEALIIAEQVTTEA